MKSFVGFDIHSRKRRAFVLAFSFVAIDACLFLCSPATRAQDKAELQTQLHRIYDSDEFAVKTFGPARWLEKGDAYTTVEPSAAPKGAREIVRYSTASAQRQVLVAATELIPPGAKTPLEIEDYAWSPDMKRLLIFTSSRQVWRAHTRGDFWVLDRDTHTLQRLGGDAAASTLQFAKFSPDGTKVAYVRASNLYVEDLKTAKITPLTQDGTDTLINGTSDWVNEEELGIRDAYRWSPDGRNIAYWQFNTQGVGNFPLIFNLGVIRKIITNIPYPEVGVFPAIFNIPYAQTGTTNSAVRVGVVSAEGGSTRWINVPGDPRENYIATLDWAESSRELVLQHLNRLQNTNQVILAVAGTGAAHTIYTDQDKAWVDVARNVPWISGGKEFVWLSEKDGWRHAYIISRDGQSERLLTKGAYDVEHLSRVDEKNGFIYFIASPDNATQRYLYRVRLDGKGTAERVTPPNSAGIHAYDISPDARWAFHTYSSFDSPPITDLVQFPEHQEVRMLEDNAALRANVAPLVSPHAEFFREDIGGGVALDAWMLKPPNFDPAKKYPLLVFIYGEPAGQTVLDGFDDHEGLFHHLVAREGYIVVSFDNQGTPAPRGREWRKIVYGEIGVMSSKQQAAALTALEHSSPYIDAKRVAVWGWSGGGTNTLNLMFRSPELYEVGMSVAPVPDQRLYDTIYQERYMGLPEQNVAGYRASSAINFADGLRGKLLLVHGSGDDNVHYQGSELLINRLIELGKPFNFMEYPNRTHAINEGQGTSLHLRSLLIRYLEENLPAGPASP